MWKIFNRAVDLIMKITAIVVGWIEIWKTFSNN